MLKIWQQLMLGFEGLSKRRRNVNVSLEKTT